MKYIIKTCDATFVGTIEECKGWYGSDSFSPKIDWTNLIETGKQTLGFPWGDITMIPA